MAKSIILGGNINISVKIILKLIKFTVLFLLIFFLGYKIGLEKEDILNDNAKEKKDLFSCPHIMEKDIRYKDYLTDYETSVTSEIEFIENPEIVKINKPFIEKEFEEGLYKLPPDDKGWTSKDLDVDGDGKKETIISANIAMNRTPHIVLIVKNGNIIFEANGANIWIKEAPNGFILSETVEFGWYPYKKELTRYISKDGGFMPVWKQIECAVDFN